ncbi:MAG: toprim domain-containing protein [Proteobacteria bacterium]|nr:toprim domain-containing protein [Pseudomonadota bacterium]
MCAETIAKALCGKRTGNDWMARCPAHEDHTPSLSIRDAGDGRVLVHCHAGCDQRDVIMKLRSLGLWPERGLTLPSRSALRAIPEHRGGKQANRRSITALTIWQSARPAGGTLVETYLASRGLRLTPSPRLRFHAGLKHPSGGYWPAMVALVTLGSDDKPLAIHRTYIARNGGGKAPVDPQKMMLGPCRGGAVRLAVAGDVLMVGEGIETCLAAMLGTGYPAWAALSTSGLRALELPSGVQDVIVLADGDDPGEKAARDCALRWKHEGRRVRIARPSRGMDFNDMLTRPAHCTTGVAQ